MNSPAKPLLRALTALNCLAVEPRLGGILFLDLDPALLTVLAHWLADRLVTTSGGHGPPRVVTLGSWVSEEELGLRLSLRYGSGL